MYPDLGLSSRCLQTSRNPWLSFTKHVRGLTHQFLCTSPTLDSCRYHNGNLKKLFSGTRSLDGLHDWIARLLAPPAEQQLFNDHDHGAAADPPQPPDEPHAGTHEMHGMPPPPSVPEPPSPSASFAPWSFSSSRTRLVLGFVLLALVIAFRKRIRRLAARASAVDEKNDPEAGGPAYTAEKRAGSSWQLAWKAKV